jgi:threonine aldolase
MNVDECGAPEALAGVKQLPVSTADGKLTRELVEPQIKRIGDEHAVQPRVLSISNASELGTVYSAKEVRALAELAHGHDMLLHVDGARLANAAVAVGRDLATTTTDAGVDMLSFGGTKNGLLGVEAVVFLDPALAEGFEFLRKQTLQLASKMRFLSAQLDALLGGDLWQRCASHANAMAARLAERVAELPGLAITQPVESNAVFATIPAPAVTALQREFDFYVWDGARSEVRWMCSWDTTEDDVDEFAIAVRDAVLESGR